MIKTKTVAGIEYSLPQVYLLQETGIGTAEYAARTCYNSFDKSENDDIRQLNVYTGAETFTQKSYNDSFKNIINSIEHSNLLDDLAWTYFHHSILEHANLTYLIKGTSRGVLQEHSRHRIQAISVQSTRYTMSPIINAFVVDKFIHPNSTAPSDTFIDLVLDMDLFVTADTQYNIIQITDIWTKLSLQRKIVGNGAFLKTACSKEQLTWLTSEAHQYDSMYSIFYEFNKLKKKRNVGDSFKHIVNDNWKVDMVVTMNLRAYKNYLELRDSGAAYFQIQWLAQAMMAATPKKYLRLIVKTLRNSEG